MEGLLIAEYEDDHSSDITLATDFYEITMAAAYYYSSKNNNNNHINQNNKKTEEAIFEMFVRKLPLNSVIYFLMNMKFNDKHISYLKIMTIIICYK